MSAVVVAPSPRGGPEPAAAQTSGPGRAVVVSKSSELVDDEAVTLSWSGFTPGPAYVLQCKRDTSTWRNCSEPTRLSVVTGADGTGTAEFHVQSGVLPRPYFTPNSNPTLQCYGGSTTVACDLVVTECEFDVAAVRTARAPLDFVAPFPGIPPQRPPGTPADEPPPIVVPPLPPPPTAPTSPQAGPEITAVGSSSARLAIEEWLNGVRQPPRSRSVDVTTNNSPTALEYLIPDPLRSRTQDFALSAEPMEGARLERLRASGRDVVHIPLSVSALAFGTRANYSIYWRERLNLTPAIIAGIYDGTVTSWGDPAITAANGGCGLTTEGGPRPTIAVLRGDQSASTLAFTSWLQVRAPQVYDRGAQEIFPVVSGGLSRNSASEVARVTGITNYQSDDLAPGSYVRLGYADHAYMRRFAVVEAAVQNAAGVFVLPSTESVDLAARELTISSSGVAHADYTRRPDPGAYPVVMVNYAVVPITNITPAKADVLHDFITYALSDAGQKAATDLGYFALTPELRVAALRSLAKLPTTASLPASSPPTTTPPTTTTPTTTPTAVAGATSAAATADAATIAEPATTSTDPAGSPAASDGEAAPASAAAAEAGPASTALAGAGSSRSVDDKGRGADARAAAGPAGASDPGTVPTVIRPIVGESFAGSVFGLSIPLVFLLGCIAVALGRLQQLSSSLSRLRSALRRR